MSRETRTEELRQQATRPQRFLYQLLNEDNLKLERVVNLNLQAPKIGAPWHVHAFPRLLCGGRWLIGVGDHDFTDNASAVIICWDLTKLLQQESTAEAQSVVTFTPLLVIRYPVLVSLDYQPNSNSTHILLYGYSPSEGLQSVSAVT